MKNQLLHPTAQQWQDESGLSNNFEGFEWILCFNIKRDHKHRFLPLCSVFVGYIIHGEADLLFRSSLSKEASPYERRNTKPLYTMQCVKVIYFRFALLWYQISAIIVFAKHCSIVYATGPFISRVIAHSESDLPRCRPHSGPPRYGSLHWWLLRQTVWKWRPVQRLRYLIGPTYLSLAAAACKCLDCLCKRC